MRNQSQLSIGQSTIFYFVCHIARFYCDHEKSFPRSLMWEYLIWPIIYEETSAASYWDKCQSNIPINHSYMNWKVYHRDFSNIIMTIMNRNKPLAVILRKNINMDAALSGSPKTITSQSGNRTRH